MADRSFSTYYSNVAHWEDYRPAFADLLAQVGAASGLNSADTLESLPLLAEDTPIVVAFVHPGETDRIQFGHRPTVHRQAGGVQDRVILVLGNVEAECLGYVLPADAFQLTGNVAVMANPANLQAHLAGGGVNHGPNLLGPGLDDVDTRRAMVLPPQWAEVCVTAGSMTFQEFYQEFLHPVIHAAVPADVQRIRAWTDWWRVATTLVTVGGNDVCAVVQPTEAFSIADTRAVNGWLTRRVVRTALLHVAAPAAPGQLTNVGMRVALGTVNDTMTAHETARVGREAAKSNRSVTTKFGRDIADMIQRVCEVDNDANLPEVHRSLARCTESSRESSILQAALLRSRATSPLPVSDVNQPMVTTHMLALFREHSIIASGVVMGEGLSPFAIICLGHPNAQDAKRKLEDANRVESGASLSLADARAIAVSDARVPQSLYHSVEKLYGFSIAVDTYFGNGHVLAVSVRQCVLDLGPAIMGLGSYYDSPSEALKMALRIIFQVQQMVFRWLRCRRDTAPANAVAVPDFSGLVMDVGAYLLSGVPQLPQSWSHLIREEDNTSREGGADRIRGGGGDGNGGQATVVNTNLDTDIKGRWDRTGFDKTSEMTRNYTGPGASRDHIPKFRGGDSVCLNWCCKGRCSTRCPRAASHKDMGPTMIQSLHGFMDQCGVTRQ